MKHLSKRQKSKAIAAGIFAVCVISLGIMCATGAIPSQSEGRLWKSCHDSKCGCHTSIVCGMCEECYHK